VALPGASFASPSRQAASNSSGNRAVAKSTVVEFALLNRSAAIVPIISTSLSDQAKQANRYIMGD
jgi:hypothetical protein